MKLTVQAIGLGELSKPERSAIIVSAQSDAAALHAKYSMDMNELAVEISVSCVLIIALVDLMKKSTKRINRWLNCPWKWQNTSVDVSMYRSILTIRTRRRRLSSMHSVCWTLSTDSVLSRLNLMLMISIIGIVQLFQHYQPDFDVSRICIKIPSTWEGMMACRTLELAGVRTLATTLFSMAQAVLAAEVNCTYIAPYVNELKVHVQPG
jgi:hypothetical protein